jgi:hypothetical protein
MKKKFLRGTVFVIIFLLIGVSILPHFSCHLQNTDLSSEITYDTFEALISTNTLTGHWVEILKPNHSWYIKNSDFIEFLQKTFPSIAPLLQCPFRYSLVFGSITLVVTSDDYLYRINRVEFYIDNVLLGNNTTEPYIWYWTPEKFSIYTIKVISYNNQGTTKETEKKVWTYRNVI